MTRESDYQAKLIRKLKRLFPGALIMKNDSGYIQGIPDLTILWGPKWVLLEVKASADAPYQPNQEYYLEKASEMGYSATIYPENEKEVLLEVQRALAN